MKKIALLVVLTTFVALSPAWAIDAPIDEHLAKAADDNSYAVKVPGMAMYGLYEIGEAPLELLNQPFDQTVSKKDHALGLFKGINRGTFNVLGGVTRGIFNILRSVVPGMGRYEQKDHQTKVMPGLAG